jgi:hypothetical protein
MKIVSICLFFILSVLAQLSRAQSGTTPVPEANPGRPTVSTPATLTPVGYLQFENGALFAEDSTEFSKRVGVGQVTKLSVLPRLELILQSEPLAISHLKDQTAVHEGEVFAGVQSVLFVGDESRPTVSFSYVLRFHTSVAPELDIGTFRQSTSIRTGYLPSRWRAPYVARSSDRHCPFPIPWASSQFQARYGIFHNHLRRATQSVISGRFPGPFARIWW